MLVKCRFWLLLEETEKIMPFWVHRTCSVVASPEKA